MTDLAWHTTTAGSDTWEDFRSNANTNFAAARRVTFLAVSSTPTTLTSDEDVVDVDATSGAITVNLDASPTTGDQYIVRKSDASGNAVTIDGNGKNIDGSSTTSLAAQYNVKAIAYNGTEWAILWSK